MHPLFIIFLDLFDPCNVSKLSVDDKYNFYLVIFLNARRLFLAVLNPFFIMESSI